MLQNGDILEIIKYNVAVMCLEKRNNYTILQNYKALIINK